MEPFKAVDDILAFFLNLIFWNNTFSCYKILLNHMMWWSCLATELKSVLWSAIIYLGLCGAIQGRGRYFSVFLRFFIAKLNFLIKNYSDNLLVIKSSCLKYAPIFYLGLRGAIQGRGLCIFFFFFLNFVFDIILLIFKIFYWIICD